MLYFETPNGKLYNQDCFKTMSGIESESIDLIISDVPYGMNFQSNYRKEKHLKIENDDNLEWLKDYVCETHRILKNNTHAYLFCSHHNVDVFKQELQKKFVVKNILVWKKNNTGMGDLYGDYAPQYEFIIYCQKGKRKLNGSRDSNIIESRKTNNELHPTQKPVDLIQYLIGKSSKNGEVVLDCFGGSGTTAVACEQIERKWICIEKELKYCEVAKNRLKTIQKSIF